MGRTPNSMAPVLHLNATRRIELALPARMFYTMARKSKCQPKVAELLMQASKQPIQDLIDREPRRAQKLVTRINGIYDRVMAEYEGHDGCKVLYMQMLWFTDLVNSGKLQLIAGSAFDQAWELLVVEFEEALNDPEHGLKPEEWDAIQRSAEKQAPKMAKLLQAEGLYV